MALVVFREAAVSARTPSLVHGFELLSLFAPILYSARPLTAAHRGSISQRAKQSPFF